MKVRTMATAVIGVILFLSACNNKMSTIDNGGDEIFLKEFKGSQRIMGARIYFQGKSKFYVRAIVITAPHQHPGLYPKEVSAMIFLLAPEEKVRKIYPENPEDLIRVIKSESLTATSINEAKDIARRFKRINKEKLQLSFIPRDGDIKRKLFSIRKGDIIEVEGLQGNLLIGSLDEEGEKSVWCPELERNEYVYVNELQILDSL